LDPEPEAGISRREIPGTGPCAQISSTESCGVPVLLGDDGTAQLGRDRRNKSCFSDEQGPIRGTWCRKYWNRVTLSRALKVDWHLFKLLITIQKGVVVFVGAGTFGYFVFVYFFETESHYVAQAVLQLRILLPQPPACWILGMHHHTWLIKKSSLLVLLTHTRNPSYLGG
jgi:hypothetical protein